MHLLKTSNFTRSVIFFILCELLFLHPTTSMTSFASDTMVAGPGGLPELPSSPDVHRPETNDDRERNHSHTRLSNVSQHDPAGDAPASVDKDCYYSQANYSGILEMRCTSKWAGYVQTPGFDKWEDNKGSMDEWLTISVPEGFHVAVRFSFIYNRGRCQNVYLSVHVDPTSPPRWMRCGPHTVPWSPLMIFKDEAIYLRAFVDFFWQESATFKFTFSFHEKHFAGPKQLPTGKYNCSVPGWRHFRSLFPCDLVSDCEGEEDEEDCPYSGSCGPGKITLTDRCYKYVFNDVEGITWMEAEINCQEYGGYLASLNTPDEWHDVMHLMRQRLFTDVYDIPILIGFRRAPITSGNMYKGQFFWSDNTVAFYSQCEYMGSLSCGHINLLDQDLVPRVYVVKGCNHQYKRTNYLCELPEIGAIRRKNRNSTAIHLAVSTSQKHAMPTPYVECPDGHVTHAFLACDVRTACWARGQVGQDMNWGVPSKPSCPAPMTSLPPSFACRSEAFYVPYSLVCDHRQDCRDGSDEDFCDFSPCVGDTEQCGVSRQCLRGAVCDGQTQCVDGSDEDRCVSVAYSSLSRAFIYVRKDEPPPPAIVLYVPTDGVVDFTVVPLKHSNETGSTPCPDTHFQCPGDGYCLPVFLRCNGVNDCPGKEDEASCAEATCPGFFRCRSSAVCVHVRQVCDGILQCPEQDDELFCNLTCPEGCTCQGHAFNCSQIFPAHDYPEMRYLDATGSAMTPKHLAANTMLIHLGLARCGLKSLEGMAQFLNLHSLDLSYNLLHAVNLRQMENIPRLKILSLAGNPLSFHEPTANVSILYLDMSVFSQFAQLQVLNLSHSGLDRVTTGTFHTLKSLRVLDLTGCPMSEIPRDLLQGLYQLEGMYASNYKLCCPATLPNGFDSRKCQAPFDEVSSCDALLRSDIYRVILSCFSALAMLGNIGCFTIRMLAVKSGGLSGNTILVSNLTISDFIMGVYLAIIGVADRLYQGTYLWEDNSWRQSIACKTAGLLSLLSSEVSAFVVCLITLDRFLALRFPFRNLHFGKRSAFLVCALVWTGGLMIVTVPLLPVTSHWEFYSSTGICVPLPITRSDFAGHSYAFAVMIVLNFILFLLIAVGQAAIYVSIRANSMTLTDSTRQAQDLAIARRLISVAVSDFLCWFPIGALGLMASMGVPVSSEANVSMAIIVLPFNSVFNPFLYNLNIILEKRRRAREEKLLKEILNQKSQRRSTVKRKQEWEKQKNRDG